MRRTRLEFLQAVTIDVTVAVNPLEAATRGFFVAMEQRVVSQPPPGLIQRNQIQGGSIRGSVIGRVRNLVRDSELTDAQLVQNSAGLGVPVVVHFRGLQFGENF